MSKTETITATHAFDDLSSKERFLAFENRSEFPGVTDLIPFPEGRATILYAGNIYDWYGRRVIIDPRIKKIIEPYDRYTDYDRPSVCTDLFIVELINGSYAVAHISYGAPYKIHDPNYGGTKYAITGGLLNRYPQLNYSEDDIITPKSSLFDYVNELEQTNTP